MELTKSSFFFKTKLSTIQKICLAGMFTALAVILQKVLAINYIAVVPFVRISFGGVGLIIFSSILLGPIYGGAVGALCDVFGWLIFDPKTMGFFPTITLIYLLLGVASYFVFCFVRLVKSKKRIMIVEYSVITLLLLFITLVICLCPSITLYGQTYTFELWQKILIPCIAITLTICLVIFNHFVGKHFEKKFKNMPLSVQHISFVAFILELFVMIIFGSLMKAIAFGFQTYLAILLCQCLVAFINIPISTIVISYALLLTKKYYN